MKSIHDIWTEARNHPDFAGGALFVTDDIATALDPKAEGNEALTNSITDDQRYQAQRAIENYIFEGVFTWIDAIRENVELTDAQRSMIQEDDEQ